MIVLLAKRLTRAKYIISLVDDLHNVFTEYVDRFLYGICILRWIRFLHRSYSLCVIYFRFVGQKQAFHLDRATQRLLYSFFDHREVLFFLTALFMEGAFLLVEE